MSLTASVSLNLEQLTFRYQPFPYAGWSNVFAPDYFQALSNEFPDRSYFGLDQRGESLKQHLFKRTARDRKFQRFMQSSSAWSALLQYARSDEFIEELDAALTSHGIPLYLDRLWTVRPRYVDSLSGLITHTLTWLSRRRRLSVKPKVGLEFSCFPNKTSQRPHTDTPTKILSLLFYFPPKEWQSSYGGGTSIYKPKDERISFNIAGTYRGFDEFEQIDDIPYRDNHGSLIIKTYNSWHGVAPILLPSDDLLRRSARIVLYWPI